MTTGVTTNAAPASLASATVRASITVPTPTGCDPPLLATRRRTTSRQDGTVIVTSTVPTPPSIAATQARKAASGSSLRITPATRFGNACSRVSTDEKRTTTRPAEVGGPVRGRCRLH